MKKKSFLAQLLGLVVITTLLMAYTVSPASGSPPERVKVLISFESQPGPAEEARIKHAGGQVSYRFHLINTIAATLPETAISHIQNNPKVILIEPDLPMHAIDIVYDDELTNSWGVSHIGAGIVHENEDNMYTADRNRGQGVNIAIIDSGIDYLHPDLDDNYKGGEVFLGRKPGGDPMDIYGHGTHVAGIACAEDNGNGDTDGPYGVVGVAPSCNLYALKVLKDNGWGSSSYLIAALEWAVDNEIHVANLSLGWDRPPGRQVEQAFIKAEQAGIVIVAAACNNGDLTGTGENVCWPGKYASVIAVAATDADDKRASFSSTGREVELAAPGVSVLSTWNDATGYYAPDPVCRVEGTDCYKYGSGTSMASPHVAGTAALIIAAGIQDTNGNDRTNDEVRQRLIDTADDLGATGWDPWFGHGLVNAAKAAEPDVIVLPNGLTVQP